ncbi:MAG: hypothetical protein HY912_15960 [Desulfomonile tiedjei]|uniref:Uncharacterized protein n=1 Tax=Desulfomonile tiedjei TaxID=2358 RepID=A0A9D6V3R9_9BACT|nr:hypothetical protein [Desulfomonile tiedjei]
MSTEQPDDGNSYLWFVAAGLALYCVVLTAVTGDIGFDGDDWWVLACPYWSSFPDSLLLYVRKFLRPVEGLYWISLFELFGFNKVVFHLCSLLLLAGSSVLMGVSLDRAFPSRRDWVSIAVLLSFFLPTVSCLTYMLFTDNSRLSMLLFWTSVLAFQRWAQKSLTWSGLALPTVLYVCSFLTYEASSFLLFVVPLLVWPVHRGCSGQPSHRTFLVRLCVGILVAFAAALAVRFAFLNGGAVGHSYLFPPFELLWSYLALLPFYLLAPFTSMSADRWALLVGLLVVVGTAGLLLFSSVGRSKRQVTTEGRFEPGSQRYLVVLGGGILVLGMLPYQLAGYGSFTPPLVETLMAKCGLMPEGDLSWFNFNWSSRIYSSASFGLAILLASGLSGWRSQSLRLVGKAAAVVVIGFMAVFHAGLSVDWREAAEIRNDLVRSLVSQVPEVKAGTNFVFLDIRCSHKRAEVIRQENGLRELVGMLYADHTLGAWHVNPHAYRRSDDLSRQAVAMPSGFLSRGQRQNEPAPHESLLLFKKSGRELVLLDRISAKDGSVPAGIAWRGVEHLTSNFARIEGWSRAIKPKARLSRIALRSGLISTLQLRWLKSTVASFRGRKYVVVREALRRHVFKARLPRVGAHLWLVSP